MTLDSIEARIADRTEQDRIGRLGLCERLGRQRVAAGGIGRTADKRAVDRDGQRQRGEGLFGLDHDLRSDTVASQQQDLHVRRPFLSSRAA